jgi:1-phosphofructokinase
LDFSQSVTATKPAPFFFTLTGNLLWERTLTFAGWEPGRTQRAVAETFQVGGKGINVSKMLRRLDVSNTALCFAGGATGQECTSWLRSRGFDHLAFASDTPTRIGIVVRGGANRETTFLGPDASPGAAAVRACAEFLEAREDGGVLAVCGSLPGWDSPDFDPLRAALARWSRRGSLIADTYGAPLAWLAGHPLDLVKINRVELEGLQAIPVSREFAGGLLGLRSKFPVRAWVVTDGPGVVRVLDEAGTLAEMTPPQVREASGTGSGDVLLACLLKARWRSGLPLAEAVANALPYAAANAADPGVADFPLPPVS